MGAYDGDRQVISIGGGLYYRSGKAALNFLLPLKDGSFVVEGRDHYGPGTNRIRFVRGPSGQVALLQNLIRHQPFAVATFDYPRK